MVNSRLGHFTATLSCSTSKSLHTNRVPLLPKVRGYFAEFLKESFLARLSMLYHPTCGGLRYGLITHSQTTLFPAAGCQLLQLRRTYTSRLRSTMGRICLTHLPTRLSLDNQYQENLTFCVMTMLKHIKSSAGISTCFPSTTPFGLALGSD